MLMVGDTEVIATYLYKFQQCGGGAAKQKGISHTHAQLPKPRVSFVVVVMRIFFRRLTHPTTIRLVDFSSNLLMWQSAPQNTQPVLTEYINPKGDTKEIIIIGGVNVI